MSKSMTQVITHAKLLAADTGFDDTQAEALAEEVYQRYWGMFLKDRTLVVADFVVFGAGVFDALSAGTARDVVNLLRSDNTFPGQGGSPGIRRDEYHAVLQDSGNPYSQNSDTTLRWGAQKSAGDQKFRIAIFPPADAGVTLAAEVLPEYVAPTGAATLEGDDTDAFNVARLTAIEIMGLNGDDQADIQRVWAPLDAAVKAKFEYIVDRTKPNARKEKIQG